MRVRLHFSAILAQARGMGNSIWATGTGHMGSGPSVFSPCCAGGAEQAGRSSEEQIDPLPITDRATPVGKDAPDAPTDYSATETTTAFIPADARTPEAKRWSVTKFGLTPG